MAQAQSIKPPTYTNVKQISWSATLGTCWAANEQEQLQKQIGYSYRAAVGELI
jgi:hypothetical protein